MQMKVMVTGARGQLGQEVVRRLKLLGIPSLPVDVEDFDLTNPDQVNEAVLRLKPDAIIHCAAYTAVDRAETEPARCCLINATGTHNLVRAALKVDAKLCLISTDYVFDGQGEQPWETDAKRNPRSVYGQSKLQAEQAVSTQMTRYFIVRIEWLFGIGGPNFVRTMLRLGREREEVRVVNDQIGSPTYAPDLAVFLCDLIRTDKYGIYHASSEGECAWSDFAKEIFEQSGVRCRVIPVPSEEYPTLAKRPLNSRLSKACLDREGFARLPTWQDALSRYLDELRAAGEL